MDNSNIYFVVHFSLPNPSDDHESTSDSNCELIKDIMEGRNVRDSTNPIDKKKVEHALILHEFMVMLSVCHTVIPEKLDDSIIYHAASPGKNRIFLLSKILRLTNYFTFFLLYIR